MQTVALIGNCQARPLAEMMKAVFDVRIETIAIVHLLRNEQEVEYAGAFEKADVVLAQAVSDTYPCEFVRRSALTDRYGEKVFIWSNLYFSGYNPELMYVRPNARAHLVGPLGDYHMSPIIAGYQEGLSVQRCAERLADPAWNRVQYQGGVERSLQELRQRESRSGAPVADLVEMHWRSRRLFYTFNHPSAFLLLEYAYRIGERLGLTVKRRLSGMHFDEPLGKFVVPINRFVLEDYHLSVDDSPVFRGIGVDFNDEGKPVTQPRQTHYYSGEELIDCFYRIYDSKRELISKVSLNLRAA
jgi:hypothetical protein